MNVMRHLSTLVLLSSLLGACGPGTGDFCTDDSHCGDGVCSSAYECAPAGSLIDVRLFWTINGEAASAETCAVFDLLDVAFEDTATFDNLIYEPVLCDPGQIAFLRMPPRFTYVYLTAYAGGRLVASEGRRIEGRDNRFQLDLSVP